MHAWIVRTLAAAGTVLAAGCSARARTGAATGPPAAAERGDRLLEGFYAMCSDAYAHRETLALRAGEFEHLITTHGIYGSRSSGSYALVGDTITLEIERTTPAPTGAERAIPPDYDFVIGQHSGRAVLWRGRETARQYAAADEGPSYAALLYVGPDSSVSTPPSCRSR